eukprot:225471-Chlamydomonas_euryale.AAC.1
MQHAACSRLHACNTPLARACMLATRRLLAPACMRRDICSQLPAQHVYAHRTGMGRGEGRSCDANGRRRGTADAVSVVGLPGGGVRRRALRGRV